MRMHTHFVIYIAPAFPGLSYNHAALGNIPHYNLCAVSLGNLEPLLNPLLNLHSRSPRPPGGQD